VTQTSYSTPTTAGRMTDPEAIPAFLEGGYAVFSIVSSKTGARFTYSAKKGNHGLLVAALSGPDNTADYRYIGLFNPDRGFKPKDPTQVLPAATAVAWVLHRLYQDPPHADPLADVEFWHAGRCSKCGRLLTDPASISRGLGPTCASKE